MKNLILILSVSLFVTSCFSQIETEKNAYVNGNKTGAWEEYYENGQLEYAGSFENGRAVGDWTYYYANGQLEAVGLYFEGDQTETWKYYYENGNLKSVDTYYEKTPSNKHIVGHQEYYDVNGVLIDKAYFTYHGIRISYGMIPMQ